MLPVSAHLTDWHGISDVCLSVPHIVDGKGVGRALELPVTDDELAKLRASADHIRAAARELGF